jgi:hypothetical protein
MPDNSQRFEGIGFRVTFELVGVRRSYVGRSCGRDAHNPSSRLRICNSGSWNQVEKFTNLASISTVTCLTLRKTV